MEAGQNGSLLMKHLVKEMKKQESGKKRITGKYTNNLPKEQIYIIHIQSK